MRYSQEHVALGTVTLAGNTGNINNDATAPSPFVEAFINGGTVTGTSPSLTPTLEASLDGGTTWFALQAGTAITSTATAKQRLTATTSAPLVRVSWPAPTGTTPSFAGMTVDFVFNRQ